MSNYNSGAITDLRWLVGDEPQDFSAVAIAHPTVMSMAISDDIVVYNDGHCVRLTHYKGQLYINGVREEREDYIALLDIFTEVGQADLPAAEEFFCRDLGPHEEADMWYPGKV